MPLDAVTTGPHGPQTREPGSAPDEPPTSLLAGIVRGPTRGPPAETAPGNRPPPLGLWRHNRTDAHDDPSHHGPDRGASPDALRTVDPARDRRRGVTSRCSRRPGSRSRQPGPVTVLPRHPRSPRGRRRDDPPTDPDPRGRAASSVACLRAPILSCCAFPRTRISTRRTHSRDPTSPSPRRRSTSSARPGPNVLVGRDEGPVARAQHAVNGELIARRVVALGGSGDARRAERPRQFEEVGAGRLV